MIFIRMTIISFILFLYSCDGISVNETNDSTAFGPFTGSWIRVKKTVYNGANYPDSVYIDTSTIESFDSSYYSFYFNDSLNICHKYENAKSIGSYSPLYNGSFGSFISKNDTIIILFDTVVTIMGRSLNTRSDSLVFEYSFKDDTLILIESTNWFTDENMKVERAEFYVPYETLFPYSWLLD